MERVGRDLKSYLSTLGTPSTIPGCSNPNPAWPWALPGLQGQPQLLWIISLSCQEPIPEQLQSEAVQWIPVPVQLQGPGPAERRGTGSAQSAQTNKAQRGSAHGNVLLVHGEKAGDDLSQPNYA